jgi:adenylate kinase
MNLIIFGPQGSGKGTQADLLSEKYGLEHIETGRIFREIAREHTDFGMTVKNLIERKEMVSDEITMQVLKHFLEKVPSGKGVIIDSAPRTSGQIEPLEKLLDDLKMKLDKAIYINLPQEESIARIEKRYACAVCYRHFVLGRDILSAEDPCPTCRGPVVQRTDDTAEGVAKRLKAFYESTMPVIEHYRGKGILVEVDGNQSVEKVFGEIIGKL